jgi:hypothetical protein
VSDPHDLTIRLQALDGRWETVGLDRYRGVVAEHFSGTANRWGSDTCSFELRRDPGAVHPDLSSFTPCEVEIAGLLSWSGRVKETPTQDGADGKITVAGLGWQYHLDDDVCDRFYVHTKLGDYKDMRSILACTLGAAALNLAGQVSNDGALTLGWPQGTPLTAGSVIAVVFDLGEGNAAERIVVEWESSNNTASFTVIARASDHPDNTSGWVVGSYDDAVSFALNTGASGTTAGTFATARRYVHLFLLNPGVTATTGAEHWIKFKGVKVFADTAYESGNASILTADMVIEDVLDEATLLLSTDRSGIDTGTWPIDEFAPGEARSAREMILAANAYENFETKVDVERRLLFRPRASAPVFEIGERSGAEFEDASANSGEEIYNRVLVQGSGPDGVGMTVERTSSTAVASPSYRRDAVTPQFTNPSFDTDTSDWATTLGAPFVTATLARNTGTFDTTPASGLATPTGSLGGQVYTETWTEDLVPGTGYRVIVGLRAVAANPSVTIDINHFGESSSLGGSEIARTVVPDASMSTSQFNSFTIDFVASSAANRLSISMVGAIYIDSIEVQRAIVTLVDRRGFLRTKVLPVKASLTEAAGERLGDLYLEGRLSTPFKGAFRAVGQGGVRRVIGGATVHPGWLLRETGQLVRCSHRVDPDTGNWGRDGEIDTVAYNHDALTADVSLDENRAGFEVLLERLAVVVGG